MNLIGISKQPRPYVVNTPLFEGPLDLLLQLIERAELDITKLALAQVTDQFLSHINKLPKGDSEVVSVFLVIATKLLQIKSEALLPKPPVRDGDEEDPGEALARQLIIYKRFKEIAALLAAREKGQLHTYLRLAPTPKVETSLDLGELYLEDLLLAAQFVFQKTNKTALGTVVAPPRITIREKITIISNYLRKYRTGTFQQLIKDKHIRLDVVVTFLAMLELVKRHLILASQENLFGDIMLEPNQEWDADEDFEIEFGE